MNRRRCLSLAGGWSRVALLTIVSSLALLMACRGGRSAASLGQPGVPAAAAVALTPALLEAAPTVSIPTSTGASGPTPVATATATATPALAPDPATLAVRASPEVQRVLDALTSQIDAEREQRGVAGISVGVVYDQTLIWSHGFGTANVDTGEAATPETLYRVGSITKLFTDTMMMQLRDAGRLQLDDPLQQYLPELQIPSSYGDDLPTLRELASHTAGLPREAPLDYWRSRDFPSEEDLIASLRNSALIGPPGKVYQYSNLGVSLEGIAMERLAAEPYAEYVGDEILKPLGMNQSGFAVTDAVRARLAAGSSPAGGSSSAPPDRFPDFGALTPAAGLYTSVDDIAHFISLQFRTSDADTGPVLSGATLREMQSPSSRGPSDFAIGWELGSVSGHGTIGHPGIVYGFTTQITLVPDSKLGVAVFTNGRTDPATIADQMLAGLLPAVRGAAGG